METETPIIANHPIFLMDSQDQLRNIKVNSDDDLRQANTYIHTYTNEANKIDVYITARIKTIQEYVMLDIKNGSHIDTWEDRDLKVFFSRESISIRFIFDIEKSGKNYSSIETQLEIADKHKIYNWDGKIRPEMAERGLEVNDVYGIRFPGFGINLTKGDKSNEVEAIKICNYLGKEFYKREKGASDGLMNKIKEFYIELNKLWDEASEISTTLYSLRGATNKYLLANCVKQAEDMNMLKVNSVVLVFHKKWEYVEFTAFSIVAVGSKYVTLEISHGQVDYTYSSGSGADDKRHYLKIKGNNSESKEEKDAFIRKVGGYLNNDAKVEIYTREEWKDFKMLNGTETDGILRSKKLTGEFKKLSENYERLKNLK